MAARRSHGAGLLFQRHGTTVPKRRPFWDLPTVPTPAGPATRNVSAGLPSLTTQRDYAPAPTQRTHPPAGRLPMTKSPTYPPPPIVPGLPAAPTSPGQAPLHGRLHPDGPHLTISVAGARHTGRASGIPIPAASRGLPGRPQRHATVNPRHCRARPRSPADVTRSPTRATATAGPRSQPMSRDRQLGAAAAPGPRSRTDAARPRSRAHAARPRSRAHAARRRPRAHAARFRAPEPPCRETAAPSPCRETRQIRAAVPPRPRCATAKPRDGIPALVGVAGTRPRAARRGAPVAVHVDAGYGAAPPAHETRARGARLASRCRLTRGTM